MPRTLSLGFSPCPNDTFIFDALVNRKIDTGDLRFEPVLEDVETLNQWALAGKLDITKLSFPAFFQSTGIYTLLDAGSALGKGVGPLIVSKSEGFDTRKIAEALVAIPGVHTTANLLLSFAFPAATKKIPMLFSGIEDAVLQGRANLGVIIHENRFTYQQKGLHKVMDLGEYWEEQLKVPIPLGGIAIQRMIEKATSLMVDELIKKSLEYAFAQYPLVTGYVRQHSQAMDEAVMRQHIDLYVNNFSLDLGEEGKQAIEKLYDVYRGIHPLEAPLPSSKELFLS